MGHRRPWSGSVPFMRLLMLGGTVFVGRHVVEAALDRGHEVTVFHRGTNPAPFADRVEALHGDRDGNLGALKGRTWDAVVDTSGFVPRVVGDSARLLADAADRYAFISSVSAYADLATGAVRDEDAPLSTPPDPEVEEVTGDTYGGLKVACEQAVRAAFGSERCLLIRPGLIVGPHDPTDRFTYWPVRIAAGGPVLAPGPPQRAVQFIDARDLATWLVRLLEVGGSGTFNAVGLERPCAMQELLETCRAVSASDATLAWADEAYLLGAGVTPWSDLPLWLPAGTDDGVFSIDNTRAVGAGLGFRPPSQTIADTLEWFRGHGRPLTGAGLSRERERQLLAGL
jgi:2'-hydroxyisoflavone reductase